MAQTSKKTQTAIDKLTDLVYNTDMKNKNTLTKENEMKLSEVMKKHIETTDPKADPWKVGIRVETTTDAHRVVHSQADFNSYVEQWGDVEVVYDEQFNVYHVPAFKVGRDSYIKSKAAYLSRSSYGCE